MNSIKYEGVASCSPATLFRIINSVERYPDFLSWCKEVNQINRNDKKLRATILINKYGISFRCPFEYVLNSKNDVIVNLPSGGPFYKILGLWQFQGEGNDTKFSFTLQLDYQDTWWVKFFIIPILKKEVKNAVKAFEKRAFTIR
jgi:ribosome-associated toxin RatA of RatAB toxin-antitoxin module